METSHKPYIVEALQMHSVHVVMQLLLGRISNEIGKNYKKIQNIIKKKSQNSEKHKN